MILCIVETFLFPAQNMRTKRHQGQNFRMPSAATIAVLVSCFAFVVSVSQATIAWYVMNRPLESTLLQQRIIQCSSTISLIQDFANRNAEFRILVAIRDGRPVRGVAYEASTSERPSDAQIKTKLQASFEASIKALDYLNAVRHLYDQKMKGLLTTVFNLLTAMLEETAASDDANAIKLAQTLHSIMAHCDSYGNQYGL